MAYANTATGIPSVSANTPFFGFFPTKDYDINNVIKAVGGSHETVTDIFFRFSVIRNVINNTSAYYVYELQDGDTPEILAEQVYKDKGAGWIIIYANQIFDPQFDWPLGYDAFNKMIIDKYGSLETAQTTRHHSEMVVERTNETKGVTTIRTFEIDNERITDDVPTVPYNYYTPWTVTTHRTGDSSYFPVDGEMPGYASADLTYDDAQIFSGSGSIPLVEGTRVYDIDGTMVTEVVYGNEVSLYDWELKMNDAKKQIKIIKSEYYAQIMIEFKKLTNISPKYLRGFK